MHSYQDTVIDRAGNALSGAIVKVYDTGTSNLSTIYSDDGVTQIDQTNTPLTTDENGRFQFYVADGRYDLIATLGAVSVTWGEVDIGEVATEGNFAIDGNATIGGTLGVTGLATLASVDINGGTIDGTVVGGSSAAAITGTTITANTRFVGAHDGTVGATTPAAGTFTTLNATGGGALTGTWTNLGSVTTIDINGGTIDGTVIGGSTPAAVTCTSLTSSLGLLTGSGSGLSMGWLIGNAGNGESGIWTTAATPVPNEYSLGATSTKTYVNASSEVITCIGGKATPIITASATGAAITGTLSATGGINSTNIGATTPGTGAFTTLSATGNVTLGDASTDTLNVGNGGIIKDASGNVGIGVTPTARNNTTLQIKDGIGFPAAQVASSDANTLDDYEEGTWTPALTWSTPGDQSFAYSTQSGLYTKVGRVVTCHVAIVTSTHTYTTATGALQISGFPFTSLATATDCASADWSGITKANYTTVGTQIGASSTVASFIASGSGQAVANIVPANVTSGTQVRFRATITYTV